MQVREESQNREEFKNQLLSRAKQAVDRAPMSQNEEATKHYLIIPFFQLLGYDPMEPREILPEADASFAEKFKNRVDYAILQDGVPVIAVEAKKVGCLSATNRGELKGYYNAVLTVKLGILTDGLIYQLYSDTEDENIMDDKPFVVVDLEQVAKEDNITDDTLDALWNLRKEIFDPSNVGTEARRKRYIAAYVETLNKAFDDPNESIVKTLMEVTGVEGKKTTKHLQEHRRYITEAMRTFFDKKLLERIFNPVQTSGGGEPPTKKDPEPPIKPRGIVTTQTERDVYNYVRYRLPFLIDREEDLFYKLDNIDFKDYKGTFAVYYKQIKLGRLFNFREGTEPKYHFEFPELESPIHTDTLSDIDKNLLNIFMKRVEELG